MKRWDQTKSLLSDLVKTFAPHSEISDFFTTLVICVLPSKQDAHTIEADNNCISEMYYSNFIVNLISVVSVLPRWILKYSEINFLCLTDIIVLLPILVSCHVHIGLYLVVCVHRVFTPIPLRPVGKFVLYS
jgi:hypothetical protein